MRKTITLLLGIASFSIAVIFLCIGLWPFNFNPENHVNFDKRNGALQFSGMGTAYTSGTLGTIFPNYTDELTLYIRLQSGMKRTSNVPSIVSVYNGRQETFVIGQWKSSLIIRFYGTPSKTSPDYEASVGNVFASGKPVSFTMQVARDTIALFIDDTLVRRETGLPLNTQLPYFDGYVVLGSATPTDHPWKGRVYALGVYDKRIPVSAIALSSESENENGTPHVSSGTRAIVYPFDSAVIRNDATVFANKTGAAPDLMIPTTFVLLDKQFFVPFWSDFKTDKWYVIDLILNLFGFIPLGFLLMAFFTYGRYMSEFHRYGITLLIGGGISITIEILQGFLPTRSSQLSDLLLNTGGTGIGILFFSIAMLWWQSKKGNYYPLQS